MYQRVQRNVSIVYRGTSRKPDKQKQPDEELKYFAHHDLAVDKYWNELMQALTEDENLRIRKTEINELKKTDIVEFMGNVRYFEERMDERLKSFNDLKNKHA